MPIYEYKCQDCEATMELLLDVDAPAPRSCGFRCALKPGENDDLRGFGTLSKAVSGFTTLTTVITKDHPTPEDAAKVGLSTYQNQGDGTFKKIAGKEGPDTILK